MIQDEIILKEKKIPVKIIFKKIKNVYFRFDDNGFLVVSASISLSLKKIKKLIIENEDAIYKLYLKKEKKKDEEGIIRLLGLKYKLEVSEDFKQVLFSDGSIKTPSINALNDYLKKITHQVFIEETEKIKRIMPNIPNFSLKIRKMKTRWGVCNYVKNTVTLNSELIKYQREIIDYVIVHELSHFTYHNHSKEFWDYVKIYFPDYKKARKELRR